MQDIKFYPMSDKPAPDESDASFSRTVIVYNEKLIAVGLGYYDFEIGQWLHFSHSSFLLKCWCYIPAPDDVIKENKWEVIAPKGYQKPFLQD
jgi:hypothetical protein